MSQPDLVFLLGDAERVHSTIQAMDKLIDYAYRNCAAGSLGMGSAVKDTFRR